MEANDNGSMEIIHENQEQILSDFDKLDLVEKEIHSLLERINILTEKEKQNSVRIKKQESLIKDITSENQALKEENDKFQIIIQQYMEKFLNLSKEANEKVNSDQIKDIACRAEMIIEKQSVMVDLRGENIELSTKNTILTQENEMLKKDMNILKESLEKLNEFISTAFTNTLHNTYTKKIQDLENKLAKLDKKKNNSRKKDKDKDKESDQKSTENNKRSPIETRQRRTTKKVHTETPQTQAEPDGIDYEALYQDDDFEAEGELSETSFGEEEFEERTPKKGRRKKSGNAQSKKNGSGKKSRKTQNKELQAVNRNTIQYHLFN